MIKASINRPKLERSLKRFAKDFGDTNAQALCRWGVQTCRELAGSSQVFGRTAEAKRKQWNSIEAGMRTILHIVPSVKNRKVRVLRNSAEVNAYVDSNRNKRGRTRKVPHDERAFVTEAIFRKAFRERRKAAGIAKGGWIGAGQDIAREQKGAARVNIGKNFLGYAQNHSKYGSAVAPRPGWSPVAKMSNRAKHSGERNVLRKTDEQRALDWGLRKTLSWYRAAMKRQNQKQKP